jgi:hypothetical protein
MSKIITIPKDGTYFPCNELNKLEGIIAETSGDNHFIMVDSTVLSDAKSLFSLGRFFENAITIHKRKKEEEFIRTHLKGRQ